MLFHKAHKADDDTMINRILDTSTSDYFMIPGSKGHKSDASLLARGFLNLGLAKNMSKEPFFEEK